MQRLKKAGNGFNLIFAFFILFFGIALLLFAPSADTSNFVESETKAIITDIVEDYDTDRGYEYNIYIDYTVGGKTYTHVYFGEDSKAKINDEITFYYDPDDPSKIANNAKDNRVLLYVIGGVLTLVGLIITIINLKGFFTKNPRKKANKDEYDVVYNETRTDFYFDNSPLDKTYKILVTYSYHGDIKIVDDNNNDIYEVVSSNYKELTGGTYEFSNKLNGNSASYQFGRLRENRINNFTTNSTFKIDGKDIFQYLHEQHIDIRFTGSSPMTPSFDIFIDNNLVAKIESTITNDDILHAKNYGYQTNKSYFNLITNDNYLDYVIIAVYTALRVDVNMFII